MRIIYPNAAGDLTVRINEYAQESMNMHNVVSRDEINSGI